MASGLRSALVGCAVLALVLCGAAAWFVGRFLSFTSDGDGLRAIDDPRPARAVVRVIDADGRPISGARVAAIFEPPFVGVYEATFVFDPSADPKPAFEATTDADGAATFAELGVGGWTIVARAPGLATETAQVVGGHAAFLDVRLQLVAAHSLSGRVTDGNPVAGAVVLASDSRGRWFRAEQWTSAVRARADERGEFVMDGLATGVWSIWVVPPGDAPIETARVFVPHCTTIELQIPAERPRAFVRPDLVETARPATASAPPQTRVRGTLVSADGSKIVGARVTLLHRGEYGPEPLAWTSSHEDGTFELVEIPASADVQLTAEAPGHDATPTSWQRADSFAPDATYRLDRSWRIEGAVATPDGTPPRNLRVWIYRLGREQEIADNALAALWAGTPQWWWRAAPTPVAADGRFSTTWDYESGRLVLYALADGFAPTASAPFEVFPRKRSVAVNVVLDPGATLRCRLLDPDGAPVARKSVRIRPAAFEHGWGATAAVTDEQGRFEVAHLPAKPVVLQVGSLRTYEVREATVTPGAGEIEARLAKPAASDED